MAGREEILKRWNFPHRQDHGVTLLDRYFCVSFCSDSPKAY
jgi:hypothetical protein